MCLHKMEKSVSSLNGQLFSGEQILLREFCVTQEEMPPQMLEKKLQAQELQQQQQQESCCGTPEGVTEQQEIEEVLYNDLLVGATQATRQFFEKCKELTNKFRSSVAYRILTRTTQPSHAISMMFVSFMLLVLWPNIIGRPSPPLPSSRAGVLVSLAYFFSFAMHFGAQMWMTFVSGLALYFNLPRHTFGRVQEILFPKYFSMGTGLSVVTLLSFIKLQQSDHPELRTAAFYRWEPVLLLQIVSLALCASLELIVWLYLAPPMLRLMHQKYHFEANETVGQEIGRFSGGENVNLRRSSFFQNVHRRFRQIHMATAIANMVALLCTFVHLHYLASRIELL